MPIYEYQCQRCGEPFEVFVRSISKAVEPECPNCGSTDTRKGVSAFASHSASGSSTGASSAACTTST
jgi:putative FmdB family regulatory protein